VSECQSVRVSECQSVRVSECQSVSLGEEVVGRDESKIGFNGVFGGVALP
jgi:hypothetical protein